jgi:hypothetical protein
LIYKIEFYVWQLFYKIEFCVFYLGLPLRVGLSVKSLHRLPRFNMKIEQCKGYHYYPSSKGCSATPKKGSSFSNSDPFLCLASSI